MNESLENTSGYLGVGKALCGLPKTKSPIGHVPTLHPIPGSFPHHLASFLTILCTSRMSPKQDMCADECHHFLCLTQKTKLWRRQTQSIKIRSEQIKGLPGLQMELMVTSVNQMCLTCGLSASQASPEYTQQICRYRCHSQKAGRSCFNQ